MISTLRNKERVVESSPSSTMLCALATVDFYLDVQPYANSTNRTRMWARRRSVLAIIDRNRFFPQLPSENCWIFLGLKTNYPTNKM